MSNIDQMFKQYQSLQRDVLAGEEALNKRKAEISQLEGNLRLAISSKIDKQKADLAKLDSMLKERNLEGVYSLLTGQEIVTEITDPFILTYNQFGKELIKKSNEYFKGTKTEIPSGNDNEEVQNMHWVRRAGLTTATYKDKQLQNLNLWPIIPEQSERLLEEQKMPKDPKTFWEDLALILYDRSTKGFNPEEAKALYDSLKAHKQELNLSNSDLEERLLVINAGIEKDSKFRYGVKPVVLPGLTEVYVHETLKKTGDHKFEYGLEHGLPAVNELGKVGKGNRTLWMPSDNKDIGLRILCRYWVVDLGPWVFVLNARGKVLVDSDAGGRVVFAPQGTRKI